MADNTLESFVVALGFKIDQPGQRKMEEGIASVSKAAGNMALALGAAALAAAAAVTKIAAGFDTLYFSSQRTGASVQNIKSLQYAFSQVGSSSEAAASAIEAYAKAVRTNPGVGQYVKDLGVKQTGDAFNDLSAAIDKIQAKNPHYVGAQMAGILGLSEEQYLTFTKYRKEIGTYRTDYEKFTKQFRLNNEEAAKSSSVFMGGLRSLGMVASVVGEKIMVALAPAFDWIVKGILSWINANPEKIETIFNAIAKAGDWVARAFGLVWDKGVQLFDYLSAKAKEMDEDGSFLRMWEKVASVFERVVGAIKGVLTWLGELDRATDMSGGLNAIKRLLGWAEGKTAGFAQAGADAANSIDRATDTGVGVPSGGGEKPGLLRRGLNAIKGALGVGSASAAISTRAPLGPVPAGLLDNIARAEGTYRTGYNTSLAHGRFLPGGKEQDLSSLTLNEVLSLQKGMLRHPANRYNSSAIGRYQVVSTTLRAAIKALDLNPATAKYDAATQDQIGHWIARKQGLGAWEGFKTHPNERAAAAAALSRRDLAGGTSPTTAPPPMPKGFNPGSFDVNRLGAAPMGSTVNNTAGAQVKMEHNTVIRIDGANDPASVGTAVERAQGRANDNSLRNAQSAIR